MLHQWCQWSCTHHVYTGRIDTESQVRFCCTAENVAELVGVDDIKCGCADNIASRQRAIHTS